MHNIKYSIYLVDNSCTVVQVPQAPGSAGLRGVALVLRLCGVATPLLAVLQASEVHKEGHVTTGHSVET